MKQTINIHPPRMHFPSNYLVTVQLGIITLNLKSDILLGSPSLPLQPGTKIESVSGTGTKQRRHTNWLQ